MDISNIKLWAAARNLDKKKGFFGKSDPFVVVINHQGKIIAKSEIIFSTVEPSWHPFYIDVHDCGGSKGIVTVSVIDYKEDGTQEVIGSFKSTVRDLLTARPEIPLIGPKKLFRSDSGTFQIKKVEYHDAHPHPVSLRLTFSAKNLAKMDAGLFGKSDPFLLIYALPPGVYEPRLHEHHDDSTQRGGARQNRGANVAIHSPSPAAGNTQQMPIPHDPYKYTKKVRFVVGKSKIIKQNLNPTWEPVTLDLNTCGGFDHLIFIRVYDYDEDGTHDLIGETNTTLRQLTVRSPTLPLVNWKRKIELAKNNTIYLNSGVLYVDKCQPLYDLVPIPTHFNIHFKGARLAKKDLLGKSDPYFKIIYNGREIYKSETIMKDLNPNWKAFDLDASEVGGLDTEFTIVVFDWDRVSSDDLIGELSISLRHLMLFEKNPAFPLINPEDKKKKKSYVNSGFLVVAHINLIHFQPMAERQFSDPHVIANNNKNNSNSNNNNFNAINSNQKVVNNDEYNDDRFSEYPSPIPLPFDVIESIPSPDIYPPSIPIPGPVDNQPASNYYPPYQPTPSDYYPPTDIYPPSIPIPLPVDNQPIEVVHSHYEPVQSHVVDQPLDQIDHNVIVENNEDVNAASQVVNEIQIQVREDVIEDVKEDEEVKEEDVTEVEEIKEEVNEEVKVNEDVKEEEIKEDIKDDVMNEVKEEANEVVNEEIKEEDVKEEVTEEEIKEIEEVAKEEDDVEVKENTVNEEVKDENIKEEVNEKVIEDFTEEVKEEVKEEETKEDIIEKVKEISEVVKDEINKEITEVVEEEVNGEVVYEEVKEDVTEVVNEEVKEELNEDVKEEEIKEEEEVKEDVKEVVNEEVKEEGIKEDIIEEVEGISEVVNDEVNEELKEEVKEVTEDDLKEIKEDENGKEDEIKEDEKTEVVNEEVEEEEVSDQSPAEDSLADEINDVVVEMNEGIHHDVVEESNDESKDVNEIEEVKENIEVNEQTPPDFNENHNEVEQHVEGEGKGEGEGDSLVNETF